MSLFGPESPAAPDVSASPPEHVQAHKRRRGLRRLWHAARYSLQGLRAACGEAAFRSELILCAIGLPLALVFSASWQQMLWLQSALFILLLAELLNTAIEAVVDMVSPQWHALAQKAKDLGSAAVLLSLVWAGWVWGSFLVSLCLGQSAWLR